MNIDDAAYATVHDYPGGSESLAPRIGTSGAVLRNKVNPNNTTHRLTLSEAVQLSDIADDDRMLQAWAAHRGKALVDVQASASSRPVVAHVLDFTTSGGDLARVLQEALADNLITDNEMRAIGDAALQSQGALIALVARLIAVHRAGSIPE